MLDKNFEIHKLDQINDPATIWDFGDGTIFTGITPNSHSYSEVGNYIISMSLAGANGCVRTIEKNVLVKPLPVIDFEYNQFIQLPKR